MVRAWRYIKEPRRVAALIMLAYVSLALAGWSVRVESTQRLAEAMGRVEGVWSIMLLVGGVLGFIAAPRGIWWLERVALVLVGVALAMASLAYTQVHFSGAPGNQLVIAAVFGAGSLVSLARYIKIDWADLDPRK